MKPMSDLCWVCQQNSAAIMRAANTPEAVKSEVSSKTVLCKVLKKLIIQTVKKAQAHLDRAVKARSYYKGQIDKAKAGVKTTFTIDGTLTIPPVTAGLKPMTHKRLTMHFSFDMAQQACYLY